MLNCTQLTDNGLLVKMLLACWILATVGLSHGLSRGAMSRFEAMDERLALLEKQMKGLEEENKYLRSVRSHIFVLISSSLQNKVDEDL